MCAKHWLESGAEILIVPNGSPYYRGKVEVRHQVALKQVIESGLPLIFVNQLGGQDELVFDGASFGLNADKSLAFQMAEFETSLSITDWLRTGDGWRCQSGPLWRYLKRMRRITAPAFSDLETM